uniref:POTRA domain-containing protein n=1 Tax=Sciadococcus taiwanensis TaxID=3028030 RepID=A0A9Y1MWZ1_9RHOD|nr:hypothetical protein SCTW_115 [Sciadococcus taiwanensis]
MFSKNKCYTNSCIASVSIFTYLYFFFRVLFFPYFLDKLAVKNIAQLISINKTLKFLQCVSKLHYNKVPIKKHSKTPSIYKKIILKSNVSKYFLLKIYKEFQLYKLEITRTKITNQELKEIAKKIEESGYFQRVTLKNQFIQNGQFITFILLPNEKINYIFFPNKLLVVSKQDIENTLFHQIAFPKSLKKFNESCINLKKKYLARGFNWTKFHLRYISSNILELNILEGIIDYVQLQLISQRALKRYNLKLIQKQLNLQLGNTLNVKTLEQGLKHLKESQICARYKYKVAPSFLNKNNLLVKIKIYELPQINSYIFARQMLVGEQTFDSFIDSLTKLVFKYFHKTSIKSRTLTRSSYNLNYLYTFDLSNYINLSNHLYKLLSLRQKPMRIKPTHSYGFRYHIKNLIGYNKQFFADLQFPEIDPLFDIYFFDPWVYFLSEKASSFTARVFRSISEFKSKHFMANSFQSTSISDLINTILLNQGIECKFNYLPSSKISLSETLQVQNLGTTCFYILHNPTKKFSYSVIDLEDYSRWLNILMNFRSMKKIYREINQQFLTFNIQLNTQFVNHNCLPNQKPDLSLKIFHFLPLDQSLRRGFAHKIQLTNSYTHESTFFRIFKNKETLIFNSQLGWLIGHQNSLPFSEKSLLSSVEFIRGYRSYNIPFSHYYYKTSFEYHLSIQQTINTGFFFIDYGKNLKNINFPYSLETIPTILDNIYPRSQKNLISMGAGLQLYTKFKKFPPLRLEYVKNTLDHTRLYLRLMPQ